MANATAAPADLLDVILHGLSCATARSRRCFFRAFMRYRGAESMDDALLWFLALDDATAADELEAFRAHQQNLGRAPVQVTHAVMAIRLAARAARAAGLTAPDFYPAPFDPAGPVALAIDGLDPRVAEAYLVYFRAFMRYRGAESMDDALLWFLALDDATAADELEAFRAHERDRAPVWVTTAITAMRRAARMARAAGLTAPDVDYTRRAAPHDPAGPVALAIDGLSTETAKLHLVAFRAFMRYRGAESMDDALLLFFALDDATAADELRSFRAQSLDEGLAALTVETRVYAIQRAVRKARAAGLTAIDIDARPSSGPERVRSAAATIANDLADLGHPAKPPAAGRVPLVVKLPDGSYEVRGKPKTLGTNKQRKLVDYIIGGGEVGRGTHELRNVSGDYCNVLDRIRRDADWRAGIREPGGPGKRSHWRIAYADPAALKR